MCSQAHALRNTVIGGMLGIVLDSNIAASDVTGNSLTGDPESDGSRDIAVCDESVSPLDRRNKSAGYEVELDQFECSAGVVPVS